MSRPHDPPDRFRLEWRDAPDAPVWRALHADRDGIRRFAAGRPLNEEYRICAIDGSGRSTGTRIVTHAGQIEIWNGDRLLPEPVEGSDWQKDVAAANARMLSVRLVRAGMAVALRAGLLDRERVADVLRLVECTFDGVGKAAEGFRGGRGRL